MWCMERARREMSEVIGLRRRALEEWFWHATLKSRRGTGPGAARPRCKRAQVPRAWIRELIGRSRRFSWAVGCAPASWTASRSSILLLDPATWGEDIAMAAVLLFFTAPTPLTPPQVILFRYDLSENARTTYTDQWICQTPAPGAPGGPLHVLVTTSYRFA